MLCNLKVRRRVRMNRVVSQESPLQALPSYCYPSAMLQRLPSCPGAQTPLIHIHPLFYRQLSSTHCRFVSAIPWTSLRLSSWGTNYILSFVSLAPVLNYALPMSVVTLPRWSFTGRHQMAGDITTLNVELHRMSPNGSRRHYTEFSLTEAQMIYVTDDDS